MKRVVASFLILSCMPVFAWAQQGSTCSNPIPLIMDGATRTYPSSSSSGNNVICTSSGSSPITYFSFTTTATPEMPLIDIGVQGGVACEVAMYAGGSCSGGNLQSASSMCFYDGEGLWSPAETYVLTANTTYILRIKIATAGNIDIAAQFYTPPNDDCAGAFSIGPVAIEDNNACHTGGPLVTPGQLCAFSLENTAFYSYRVATTGISTISITNIACDNGAANNSSGFQIGFFTGNCSVLTPLNCSAGSGTSVIATTALLAAGTKVYVAIDGTAGSNCRYSISATNAIPIPVYLKYFTAWKSGTANVLKWASLQETDNDYFEVERSENGKDFFPIGRITGQQSSQHEIAYQLVDPVPPAKCQYRLKQVDLDGNIKYFKIVSVSRTAEPNIFMSFENPVTNNLILDVQTNFKGPLELMIVAMNGIVVYKEEIKCHKGINQFYKSMSRFPDGKYVISLTGENVKSSKVFIKTGVRYVK